MKVAIIDDEEDARFVLRSALEQRHLNDLDTIIEIDSVKKGIELLKTEDIDILFLDIKLQDGTGFDILESVSSLNAKVIFVTAYDEFALRAFEVFAFAYLVKPFKDSALDAVMKKLNDEKNMEHQAKDWSILSNAYKEGKLEKIVVPDIEGFRIINLADVLYLKSDSNYTEFHLKDHAKVVVSRTLKEYDKMLSPEGFFRTHRTYLINLIYVTGYSKVDGGMVILDNNVNIPIGRRRLAEFRALFLGQ